MKNSKKSSYTKSSHSRKLLSGMTDLLTRVRAFTLMELLVVVLIITVLAAVAVPQYKIAVARSRLASIKPLVSAFKIAQENFYLTNGIYSNYDKLDISVPCTLTEGDKYSCGDFVIDFLGCCTSIDIAYCPGHAQSYSSCLQYNDYTFRLYLDKSDKKGTVDCLVAHKSNLGRKICAKGY